MDLIPSPHPTPSKALQLQPAYQATKPIPNICRKRRVPRHRSRAFRDSSAGPLLRTMLEDEPDPGGRLTIAGALWKLVRDPVFIECLERTKGTGTMVAHINQVL